MNAMFSFAAMLDYGVTTVPLVLLSVLPLLGLWYIYIRDFDKIRKAMKDARGDT